MTCMERRRPLLQLRGPGGPPGACSARSLTRQSPRGSGALSLTAARRPATHGRAPAHCWSGTGVPPLSPGAAGGAGLQENWPPVPRAAMQVPRRAGGSDAKNKQMLTFPSRSAPRSCAAARRGRPAFSVIAPGRESPASRPCSGRSVLTMRRLRGTAGKVAAPPDVAWPCGSFFFRGAVLALLLEATRRPLMRCGCLIELSPTELRLVTHDERHTKISGYMSATFNCQFTLDAIMLFGKSLFAKLSW